MATTGFWPVRGKLKDIIDYAENPDKTTAKEYLDNDLYDALRYVENDDKTDRKMYVTALNCSKSTAYEQMTAVKRKYGERGKIIPATESNTFINSFCGVWGAFLKSVPRKTQNPFRRLPERVSLMSDYSAGLSRDLLEHISFAIR